MTPTVARELALGLERIEAAAWRDADAAATGADREALGLRGRAVAGAWLVTADRVESLLMNRVLGLGLGEDASREALEAVLAHYADRGGGFAVNLCPFAAPGGLERVLEAHGFATFFHHLKWVRGAAEVTPAPTTLRIATAGAHEAADWALLAARVFEHSPAHARWSSRTIGRPGWTHWFAWDGGTRVALAASFVQGEFAWLGSAGTSPGHRRRGAQRALLTHRVSDALARGARWLTLETAPDLPDLPGDSLRNAARAGFHPAYERPSWIRPVR